MFAKGSAFTTCVALAFCVSGCGFEGSRASVNPVATLTAEQAAYQNDPVKFYLSINPQATIKKDVVEIQPWVELPEPDAAFLQIFSALRRYPRVTNIRAHWNYGLMSGSTYATATYNRKTKMLWYRETNFNWGSKGEDEYYVYEGVTPQMIYRVYGLAQSGTPSGLKAAGCKLIFSCKMKRP